MSDNPELLKIREEIDAIDQQIQTLINARADCAMRVAEVKQAEMAKTGEAPVYYRPEREAQVLALVMERNEGPLPKRKWLEFFVKSCPVVWHSNDRWQWDIWARLGPSQKRLR